MNPAANTMKAKDNTSNATAVGQGEQALRLFMEPNRAWKTVEVNGEKTQIPEDWELKNIGQNIDFKLGNTPPKTGDNYAGDVPWVTISNISGAVTSACTAKISRKKAKILPKGSLIGSFKMTVGRFSILGMDAATNEAIVGVAPSGATGFDLNYLRMALVEPFIKGASTNGQGVQLLNTKTIKSLNFLAPRLQEQTLIAQVLGAQETQVQELRNLAAVERQRQAWLSDELLSGRLRVEFEPGYESVEMPSDGRGGATLLPGVRLSENLGWKTVDLNGDKAQIPVKWRPATIGKAFDVIGGGTPLTSEPSYWGGNIVWVGPKYMGDDRRFVDVDHPDHRRLTEAGASKVSDQPTPKGSLILSCRAPVGYANIAPCDLYTNQGCYSLIAKEGSVCDYAYFWIRKNKALLNAHASGTTFMEISRSNLSAIEMALPPPAEQTLISQVLSTQEAQVADLERLADVEQTRLEWLSDELLSGRIRVRTQA